MHTAGLLIMSAAIKLSLMVYLLVRQQVELPGNSQPINLLSRASRTGVVVILTLTLPLSMLSFMAMMEQFFGKPM